MRKAKGKLCLALSLRLRFLLVLRKAMAFEAQQFLICSAKIALSHGMPPGEARKLGSCQLHPERSQL